jgi:hypothetical protein
MDLRHASALALIGWYLMMPLGPINVPVNQKVHIRSFDTAQACEAYRDGLLKGRAVPPEDLPEEVKPPSQASQTPQHKRLDA